MNRRNYHPIEIENNLGVTTCLYLYLFYIIYYIFTCLLNSTHHPSISIKDLSNSCNFIRFFLFFLFCIVDDTLNKNKEVAWLVSNCQAKSGRLDYVKELSKYIGVDIYGLCGNDRTCPRSRDCFKDVIEPQYYFYLSFENSLCQDYVTEKLYKPMR